MSIFRWLRHLFRKRSEDHTINNYVRCGCEFGAAVSYIYMGECIGFGDLLSAWEKSEKEYSSLGYRTLTVDAFVGAGGWHDPLLGLRESREESEDPIFHASYYREHFFGKTSMNSAMQSAIQDPFNDKVVDGTYYVPSTKHLVEKK